MGFHCSLFEKYIYSDHTEHTIPDPSNKSLIFLLIFTLD